MTPYDGAFSRPARPPDCTPRAALDASDCIDAVEMAMRDAVSGDGEDPLGRMGAEHLATGGKRVRARLALAAAEALGVAREDAVGWAAAVELLHNATLIHDDLQDGDVTRRGSPTTWAAHGAAQAINAGDLLLMLPLAELVDRVPVPDGVRYQLTRSLAQRAAEVCRGQALEPFLAEACARAPTNALDAYLRCINGKTAALIGVPVEGAALIAGRSRADAIRYAEPFVSLGLLFQLQDDVLDLYGDKGRNERGSDIREGKVSALVVEHLRLHPHDAPGVLATLALPRDQTPDSAVDELIARFAHGGALPATLRRIQQLASRARLQASMAGAVQLLPLVTELTGVILRPISGLFSQWTNLPAESGADAAAV